MPIVYPNSYPVNNYPNMGYSNPYQQNYVQPQPYIPQPQYQPTQPQQSSLVGRVINDASEIRPNETPTTGAPAVFVKADGSAVYLTYMDQTGRIVTREFCPKEAPQENPVNEFETLKAEIAEIKSMVSQLVN